jgi:hypothetical protein
VGNAGPGRQRVCLANGLVPTLLKNVSPDALPKSLSGGDAPAFVKSEQPFSLGGPVWRIELVSPTWPHPVAASAAR